jgi:molybdopterin-guanine dinucleotide biosynthesis protein A
VADPPGPACPLRGLVGALEAAREERVLVLGCGGEPPAPDLVLALLAAPDADAVVPRTEAGSEPLRALYRREPVRSRARTRFEAGQLALQELLDELDVWHLEGPALASLCAAGCEQREGKGA